MKACVRRRYGSHNEISILDIERPVPGKDQVLIKVSATTVNRTDCANLTGKPFIMHLLLGLVKPKRIGLGTDFAGTIIQKGTAVRQFELNDRVFGFVDMGTNSQAEYLIIKASDVYRIPEGIDFNTAAGALEGAHYAYTFVHKVSIKAGQSVLINGATGGIGSALLQFVRENDVHITATCNTENMSLIKSLGADEVIDYTKEDFTNKAHHFDFVFDAVGKSTFGKCRALLKPQGVYISSELGPYSQNIFFALYSLLFGKKKVIFPMPYAQKKTIPYISERLQKNTFKPLIDRIYKFEDISQAYKDVLRGEKIGNVIILLHEEER